MTIRATKMIKDIEADKINKRPNISCNNFFLKKYKTKYLGNL